MILRMLAAFFTAGFANFGAILTQEIHVFAIANHVLRCQPADSRTIPVQHDATCHLCPIFAFAGIGTALTGFGTGNTGVDTGLVVIM